MEVPSLGNLAPLVSLPYLLSSVGPFVPENGCRMYVIVQFSLLAVCECNINK